MKLKIAMPLYPQSEVGSAEHQWTKELPAGQWDILDDERLPCLNKALPCRRDQAGILCPSGGMARMAEDGLVVGHDADEPVVPEVRRPHRGGDDVAGIRARCAERPDPEPAGSEPVTRDYRKRP